MSQFLKQNESKLGIGIFILFVVGFVLFRSFVIVESGFVGVVRLLGAVDKTPLPEGFHIIRPFLDKVEQMDIRLTQSTAKSVSASKDLQIVRTEVTVQYSLTGAVAPSVYQRVGQREAVAIAIVSPAIEESVKAITAKYTAEELITKRAEVKNKIQEAINTFINVTLLEKDIVNALRIANVAITDFSFSEEFNRAIELKVKAEQEALQAKNEKIRRITQAEAAAVEKKLAADAQAYQITVQAKARAQAISQEAKALKQNPELIQLRLAEKWDGKLPQFTGDKVPLISMDSFTKNTK